MIRTQIYLPEDLKQSLESVAKREKKTVAEIVRRAVKREVKAAKRRRPTAGATLLKIASYAKKGRKDSSDFFEYAYGKKSSYRHLYKRSKNSK